MFLSTLRKYLIDITIIKAKQKLIKNFILVRYLGAVYQNVEFIFLLRITEFLPNAIATIPQDKLHKFLSLKVSDWLLNEHTSLLNRRI